MKIIKLTAQENQLTILANTHMKNPNRHVGSNFDDFLKEEGILEEVQAAAKIEKAWLNEAQKRLKAYKSGKLQTFSFKEFYGMKKLKKN